MDSTFHPAAAGRTAKAHAALVKISTVAADTGVPPKTIRYYEIIGLIPPAPRSPNGYRMYGAADIQVLRFVKRARTLGFTIAEIASLLDLWRNKKRSSAGVKALASKRIREVNDKIAELLTFRHAVAELAERCHGDDRPECPILDDLANGRDDRAAGRQRAKPAFLTPY